MPFVEPWNALQDIWWLTLIPFSFGVGMVYKAWRLPDFKRYWPEVGMFTVQVTLGIAGLGLVLALIVDLILPRALKIFSRSLWRLAKTVRWARCRPWTAVGN